MRTKIIPKLESSVSLFLLDLTFEDLFLGDAGDTAASRPSRRYGIEWTNQYRPLSWLSLEADIAGHTPASGVTIRIRRRYMHRSQDFPPRRSAMLRVTTFRAHRT